MPPVAGPGRERGRCAVPDLVGVTRICGTQRLLDEAEVTVPARLPSGLTDLIAESVPFPLGTVIGVAPDLAGGSC